MSKIIIFYVHVHQMIIFLYKYINNSMYWENTKYVKN